MSMWDDLPYQSKFLSAAHIILGLSCFLYMCIVSAGDKHVSSCGSGKVNHVFVNKTTGTVTGPAYVRDEIHSSKYYAKRIALPLIILSLILMIPGIYFQRKISPHDFWGVVIGNTIGWIILGTIVGILLGGMVIGFML